MTNVESGEIEIHPPVSESIIMHEANDTDNCEKDDKDKDGKKDDTGGLERDTIPPQTIQKNAETPIRNDHEAPSHHASRKESKQSEDGNDSIDSGGSNSKKSKPKSKSSSKRKGVTPIAQSTITKVGRKRKDLFD
jgi:hypothetical protein